MNKPSDFNAQLVELTVKLTGMVAERIAHWSKDMNPPDRKRILDMIEDSLPTVITNAIAKTTSLHSPQGVEYLEQQLDSWADHWAKKLCGRN